MTSTDHKSGGRDRAGTTDPPDSDTDVSTNPPSTDLSPRSRLPTLADRVRHRSRRLVEPGWPRRILVAVLSLTAALLRSWQLGVDTNFDLLNYHLYKSTSLLDGSIFSDVAVSSLGTFLNPAIEIPFGICVQLFGVEGGLIVGAAVVQLACYIAVWRLARAIADYEHSPKLALPIFLVAITGSATVSISFTTFGDWTVAALLCEAVRSILVDLRRTPEHHTTGRRSHLVAGLWIGAAIGLKYTAAPLAIGVSVAILAVSGWRRWFQSCVGALIGLAVSAGPWMVYLQLRYSSPLFPLYNNILGSSSAPATNEDDNRFGATDVGSVLEFPTQMFRGSTEYAELVLQDWRFLIAVALVASYVVLRSFSAAREPLLSMLVIMSAVSFVIWIVVFGIYRYFLFGEIVASILVCVLLFRIAGDQRIGQVACLAVGVIGLGFLQAPNWGRNTELASPEFRAAIDALDSPPDVVAVSASPPIAFVLEELPDSTTAVALTPFSGPVRYAGQIGAELDRLFDEALSSDSLYALTPADATALIFPFERLTIDECVPFTVNDVAVQFCHVIAP